ncbi:MAG: sulfatase-like hydrolase/transferase, partial [Rikenellaceae bacterium]
RIGFMKGGEAAKWVDEDMADYFVGKVADFIDENKDEPFFLYYGLHQPHVPRAPHSRFVGSTNLGPRGDAIVEADWCVGELIAKLKKEGLLENTLIVFSSDNGPVLNDGYKDQAAELLGNHTPAGALRGGKYSLFDAGTRVPFFAYWKGQIKPTVSNALISQLDLLASFATLIGAEIEGETDSENYLTALLGESDEARTELIVEANHRLAFRKGKYALIPPYGGNARNQTGNELGVVPHFSIYDLSTDLGQTTDLSTTNKELLEELKSEFLERTEGYYKSNVPEIQLQ